MSKNKSYLKFPLKNFAPVLYHWRREAGLCLSEFQEKTSFSAHKLELMEMGKLDIKFSDLCFLVRFYQKKIKIELVD